MKLKKRGACPRCPRCGGRVVCPHCFGVATARKHAVKIRKGQGRISRQQYREWGKLGGRPRKTNAS